MTQSGTVIYTAKTLTSGGRENGVARSLDGRLDVRLSASGGPGIGTNPEQLFAAGWSASFEVAMGLAAGEMHLDPHIYPSIHAEIDLCLLNGEYTLQARLNVSLPGLQREIAQALIDAAHATCAYSKATRGNIDVVVTLV